LKRSKGTRHDSTAPSDVSSTLPVEAAAISLPGELKGHKHYDAQLEKDLAELRKQYPRAVSQPDARLVRLKNYFEQMGSSLPEVTTMRLSDEVKDMLIDPAQVRDEKRSQVCSDDDLRRVVELELEAATWRRLTRGRGTPSLAPTRRSTQKNG
jgi:hypothetical protein